MHCGIIAADFARQIGDEGRAGDAGGNVLDADCDQQALHARIGTEHPAQRRQPAGPRHRIDMHRAFGQIGIDEIAQHRQHRTDQDRRHPAQPGKQHPAQRDPRDGHEHAENLRRERHFILRIVQKLQVERIGEAAAPHVVAQRISQDHADGDQHAPAEARRQFGQRGNQCQPQMIDSGHRAAHAFADSRPIGQRGHHQRQAHRGQHDQRRMAACEIGHRRPRHAGYRRSEHRRHEQADAADRPAPAQRHHHQPCGSQQGRGLIGHCRGIIDNRARRIGGRQRDQRNHRQQSGHHSIDPGPGHARRQNQREGAADQRRQPIAKLIER